MKLWRISQTINSNYDTFSDAIVASDTGEEARRIHPGDYYDAGDPDTWTNGSWAAPHHVVVELIGEAVEGTIKGVICASFHAG